MWQSGLIVPSTSADVAVRLLAGRCFGAHAEAGDLPGDDNFAVFESRLLRRRIPGPTRPFHRLGKVRTWQCLLVQNYR